MKRFRRMLSVVTVVLMLTAAFVSMAVASAENEIYVKRIENSYADSSLCENSRAGSRMLFSRAVFDGCYGNQLSGVARELYDSMKKSFVTDAKTSAYSYTFKAPFTFKAAISGGSIVTNDELREVQQELDFSAQAALDAFLYDYPQVYWLKIIGTSYSISASGNSVSGYTGIIKDIEIVPTEIYSGASAKASQYKSALNAALKDIEATESRYETLKNVHDYICDNAWYNLVSEQRVHTSEPFFIGDGGVVCEGYAETFKVICDRLDIPCVLVSGDAGGAHMWNYVQMDDSKWYLVDVTWDDQQSRIYDTYFLANANTVGFDGVAISKERTERNDFSGTGVFSFTYPVLSSAAYTVHTHQWESSYTVDLAPTCTEKGSKSIHCKTCDETKSVTEIPATNHTNRYILDAIAPTCTTVGYTEGVYCVDCQILISGRTEVPAAHTDNNGDSFCDVCEIYLSYLYKTGSCGNNLTYEWYENGTVFIIGEGRMTDYSSGDSPFSNSDIKKVVLKQGVTSVGDFAFQNCEKLDSVSVPDSLISFGKYSFYYAEELDSISICNGVTTIGNCAFYNCKSITSLTLPDSIMSIGSEAFSGTAYYKDASNWDGDVLYIGKHLIEAKNEIAGSYAVKPGTLTIAGRAFHLSKELTGISIPNSVKSIGWMAFYSCNGLKNITIPDSVTLIEAEAFWLCEYLETVTLSSNINLIAEGTFGYCKGLKAIVIPDKVKTIGSGAFRDCTSLESVQLSKNLTTIGSCAFYNCRMPSLTIPESVTTIYTDAFNKCTSLSVVYIPKGVSLIGGEVFGGCTALTEINVDDDNLFYSSQDGVLFNKNKTELIQYTLGNSRTNYIIPDGVEKISENAFTPCYKLKSIVIPVSVSNIGMTAFEYCSMIRNVYYLGSQAQWKNINIGYGNNRLTSAEIEYNYCLHTDKVSYEKQEPTCTAFGYEAGIYCPDCENWIEGHEEIPATDHTWDEGVITTASTCKTHGTKSYTCQNDASHKKTEQVPLDASNHEGGTYLKNTAAATCTADGYSGDVHCKGCDKKLEAGNVIPATDHANKTEHAQQDSTCTEIGYTAGVYCPDCKKWLSGHGEIPELPHAYETVTVPASFTADGMTQSKCSCGDVEFSISIPKLSSVKLSTASCTYNGKTRSPSVSVTDSAGNALVNGTDYDVTIPSGRKNPGVYEYKISFKGNYEGEKTLTFTILPKAPAKISATQSTSVIKLSWSESVGATGYRVYQYSPSKGKYVQIASIKTTTYRKATNLKAGTEYKFKIKPYTKLSDGTVLWGTASAEFVTATECKAPSITSVASSSKSKATVKWSDVDGETGYQLYYSTSKNGTYKKVNSYAADKLAGSKTFSSAASGKTICFKVRAYKKVNGQTIFSEWSAVKSVKLK